MATKNVLKQASASKGTVSKKTGSSGAGSGKSAAKSTSSAVQHRAPKAEPLQMRQRLEVGKVYTVTLKSTSKKGSKTTVTFSPGKAFEATITSAPGKLVKLDLSRSKLVGKFPEVKHLPAPKSKLKLDEETRKSLLASMVLS